MKRDVKLASRLACAGFKLCARNAGIYPIGPFIGSIRDANFPEGDSEVLSAKRLAFWRWYAPQWSKINEVTKDAWPLLQPAWSVRALIFGGHLQLTSNAGLF